MAEPLSWIIQWSLLWLEVEISHWRLVHLERYTWLTINCYSDVFPVQKYSLWFNFYLPIPSVSLVCCNAGLIIYDWEDVCNLSFPYDTIDSIDLIMLLGDQKSDSREHGNLSGCFQCIAKIVIWCAYFCVVKIMFQLVGSYTSLCFEGSCDSDPTSTPFARSSLKLYVWLLTQRGHVCSACSQEAMLCWCWSGHWETQSSPEILTNHT